MSWFVALMYHGLKDPPKGNYSIGFGAFNAQLEWLKSEGFVIEGLAGLDQRLAQNEFPERYVIMTFDDGHKSDLRAAEMLRKVDAQATFFLVRDFCRNKKRFLDESEIKELSTLCSIGSHGLSHSPLSQMSLEQMRFELLQSKKWLEDLVGNRVSTFSAPGGYAGRRVVRQARSLGYSLCGNSVEWWNETSRVVSTRTVNRIAVRSSFLMPSFRKAVTGNVTFFLKRRLRSSLLSIPKQLISSSQTEHFKKMFSEGPGRF